MKVKVSASLPPADRRKSEAVCAFQALTVPLLSLRPADKGLGGSSAGQALAPICYEPRALPSVGLTQS